MIPTSMFMLHSNFVGAGSSQSGTGSLEVQSIAQLGAVSTGVKATLLLPSPSFSLSDEQPPNMRRADARMIYNLHFRMFD